MVLVERSLLSGVKCERDEVFRTQTDRTHTEEHDRTRQSRKTYGAAHEDFRRKTVAKEYIQSRTNHYMHIVISLLSYPAQQRFLSLFVCLFVCQ